MSNARNLANLLGTGTTVPSAKMPAGSILQVKTATKTASQSNASSNSFSDITDLSQSITPRSTSSKILILCNISMSSATDATGRSFRFIRGSTHIGGGSEGSRKSVSFFGSPMSADSNMAGTTSMHFLDSPNTTSATTYKVQMTGYNSGVTTYINTNISRGGQAYDDIATSNLTLIEVQG
tara:strand:- start:359 stop:898 length:540 start_codon:yes stop_codon:yes gene_type:complete